MPSSPISVLITTASLCLLLLSLVASFSVVSNNVMRISLQVQLEEVTNRVASGLVDMRSFVSLSPENESAIVKFLDLPKDLLALGYVVGIAKEGGIFYVVASMEMYPSVSARTLLWSEGDQAQVQVNGGTFGMPDFTVEYGPEVHSGEKHMLVWGRKTKGVLSVGLGAVRG